ncbi:type II toxin-antitoxin system RelE/ParE family toxin [Roseburia hominis]
MDKYCVMIPTEVKGMIRGIYADICDRSLDNTVAEKVIGAIEKAILSLEYMPYRGTELNKGEHKGKKYRRLVVKKHIIVYRVFEETKQVIIVFVKSEKMNI